MPAICFYFQVHQPYRAKKYSVFNVGNDHDYFVSHEDRLSNEKIFHKVSQKCYLPTNKVILDLLNKHPEMRVSYSLSGVFIEQAEQFNPEVLDSFKRLVDTGRAEILEETYHHSLSFLFSKDEFKHQVNLHRKKIEQHFGVKPKVFRNTELIYSNEVAKEIENMGYTGIIAEGVDHLLGWRSPNFVYKPSGSDNIKLLLKNYKLSDDIAFRFSNKGWDSHPLTAPTFANWVSDHNGNGHIINLFMDYETFGEHQWEDTGIFEFLYHLPTEVLKNPDNSFVTPSEAIERYPHSDEVDYPYYVSWADTERDLSAWLSNSIQKDAMAKIYAMEDEIKSTKDELLIEDWRKLQTSDHFYYMCTKYFSDGDVHKYFNPYDTPYEAFITYMNILSDLRHRLDLHGKINKEASPVESEKAIKPKSHAKAVNSKIKEVSKTSIKATRSTNTTRKTATKRKKPTIKKTAVKRALTTK